MARAREAEVASHGSTVDEPLANLREALGPYFEHEPVLAVPVDGPIVAPVDIQLSTQRPRCPESQARRLSGHCIVRVFTRWA